MFKRYRLSRELIEAIENNDVDQVRSLLARGANANARTRIAFGIPAIVVAFRRETFVVHSAPDDRDEGFHNVETDAAILAALLENGANPNVRGFLGDAPLSIAAEWHQLDAVRLLLQHGADVNFGDRAGVTPLMTAVIFDSNPDSNREVILALLDAGANLDAQERREGSTALMYAIANGCATAAALLLDRPQNLNLRDREGQTALRIARANTWNRGIAKLIPLLEEAGAQE